MHVSVDKTNPTIRWIVIYLLDSIIHLPNNLGLVNINKIFLFLKFVESTSDHLAGQWTNFDRQWRNDEGQWKA